MTKTKAFLMAATVMFFSGTAMAQITNQDDAIKPRETQDGNLQFQGVSDRKLNEFIAENLFLMNRRLSTMDSALLMSMLRTQALPKETVDQLFNTSVLLDKSIVRTTRPFLPDVPGAKESIEKFLQTKPVPEDQKSAK